MKRPSLLLLLFILTTFELTAQVDFTWLHSLNSIGQNGAYFLTDAAKDDLGNIYVTARFRDTIALSTGTTNVQLSPIDLEDVYIAKYNSKGTLVWYKHFKTPYAGSLIYDIHIHNNDLIICGRKTADSLDFNPGGITSHFISSNDESFFVAKYKLDGSFVWFKAFETSGSFFGRQSSANKLATDNQGNIYFTGRYSDSIDFDPSSQSHFMFHSTSFNQSQAYICKLDSNGNFQFVQNLSQNGRDFYSGVDIIVDKNYNAFVLSTQGNSNKYTSLNKVSNTGNVLWSKLFPFDKSTFATYGRNLLLLNDTIVIFTDFFTGTNIDVDPDNGIHYVSSKGGGEDIIIMAMSSNGNFLWAQPILGNAAWGNYCSGLAHSKYTNEFYLSAIFVDTLNFINAPSLYGSGSLIARYNHLGYPKSVQIISDSLTPRCEKLIASNDTLITIGSYNSKIKYILNGLSVYSSEAVGFNNAFIGKVSEGEFPLSYKSFNVENPSWKIFPNPSSGQFVVDLIHSHHEINLKIYDQSGRLIKRTNWKNSSKISAELPKPKGLYLLYVESEGVRKGFRIIKE